MKHKLLPLVTLLAIAFVALLWTACNKPTPFGEDLLNGEAGNYDFTDTLAVRCYMEREDSVITSSSANYYLCGELNDPIFGKSSSELFTQLRLDNLDPGFDPATMTVDSVVMYMRYSTAGIYGDTLQPQTLRVMRLNEVIQWDKNYFSDDELAAGAEIGRVDNFLPKPRKPDSLFSATTKAPYLRIRLDDSFGNELLNMDSITTATDTAFWRSLRGLKIVTSAGAASPGAMLSFNLEDGAYSLVRLYYSQHDTTHKVFDYFFAGVKKFSHYTHDYTGTVAGQQIGQPGDNLLYVQSMQGIRVRMEFPTLNTLDNLIVNKADLEFTVATVPNDLPLLFPAEQTILTQIRGDTTFIFTSDVLYSLGSTLSEGFNRFGGYPETEIVNGVSLTRYHLSLSAVLQKMVDDDTATDLKNRTLYLSIYPQNRTAQRMIVYGPKSPIYPLKLNLKYTHLE
ncbi:MAG: DUF4270 family protein [Saprospiraceae bacterium]